MPPSGRSNRLKVKYQKVPGIFEARSLLNQLQNKRGHASDRVAAIVGGSLVEAALRAAILEHFSVNRDDPTCAALFSVEQGGLLSTLGSRISLAYCLGVFGPKTLNDLRRIKKLRNIFAHTTEIVSFQDSDVASICAEIESLEYYVDRVPKQPKKRYLLLCEELSTRMRLRLKVTSNGGNAKVTPAPMP